MVDIRGVTPELRGEPPPGEEVEIRSLQLDEPERLRAAINLRDKPLAIFLLLRREPMRKRSAHSMKFAWPIYVSSPVDSIL